MPARPLLIAAATLAVTLLFASGAARANSFMLAPGAPTAAELSSRIVSLEAELGSQLRGAALREFRREKAERDAEHLREVAGPPQNEAHAYARLQRRWLELDARQRQLQGSAPGANPTPAASPAPPSR